MASVLTVALAIAGYCVCGLIAVNVASRSALRFLFVGRGGKAACLGVFLLWPSIALFGLFELLGTAIQRLAVKGKTDE